MGAVELENRLKLAIAELDHMRAIISQNETVRQSILDLYTSIDTGNLSMTDIQNELRKIVFSGNLNNPKTYKTKTDRSAN